MVISLVDVVGSNPMARVGVLTKDKTDGTLFVSEMDHFADHAVARICTLPMRDETQL